MRATSSEVPSERSAIDDDVLPTSRAASITLTLGAIATSTGALALLLHVYASGPRVPPLRAEIPTALAPVATHDEGAAPPELVLPPIAPEVAPSPAPLDPNAVTVPDFTTLRVPVARRRARELGIHLVIRDTWSGAIDRYTAPRYRVLSQTVAPGAHVERGDVVRAVAEDPSPVIVSGY